MAMSGAVNNSESRPVIYCFLSNLMLCWAIKWFFKVKTKIVVRNVMYWQNRCYTDRKDRNIFKTHCTASFINPSSLHHQYHHHHHQLELLHRWRHVIFSQLLQPEHKIIFLVWHIHRDARWNISLWNIYKFDGNFEIFQDPSLKYFVKFLKAT